MWTIWTINVWCEEHLQLCNYIVPCISCTGCLGRVGGWFQRMYFHMISRTLRGKRSEIRTNFTHYQQLLQIIGVICGWDMSHPLFARVGFVPTTFWNTLRHGRAHKRVSALDIQSLMSIFLIQWKKKKNYMHLLLYISDMQCPQHTQSCPQCLGKGFSPSMFLLFPRNSCTIWSVKTFQ